MGEGGRTLRSSEVDHVSVFFEHVYLLDCLDGLDVEFFEGGLEFFVVGAGCFVDFLYFSPGGTFASEIRGGCVSFGGAIGVVSRKGLVGLMEGV